MNTPKVLNTAAQGKRHELRECRATLGHEPNESSVEANTLQRRGTLPRPKHAAADFVLGNVPHPWIPPVSADHAISFLPRVALDSLPRITAYPGLRCSTPSAFPVASQSLAHHADLCTTTADDAPGYLLLPLRGWTSTISRLAQSVLIAGLAIWLVWPLGVYGQEAASEAEIEEGPRGMLRVMHIDDSQMQFIRDDRQLVEDEQETLRQLLFRLPTFSQVDVEQWSQPIDDWQELLDDPAPFRFEFFQLRGEVTGIRVIDVIPEMVSRLRFRQYFELTIQSNEQTSLALVRFIPKAWQSVLPVDTPIRQSVRLHAMLLKRMTIGEKPGLVFAASRVRWHPSQAAPELGVSSDQVLLGQLGLDISRLEEVQHKQGMQALDRECFYQSLAAVRLAKPEQLAKIGRREFDISRMIETPEEVVGELYTLRGRARRAVLIRVEDPDIQARFGIDHYYEVEVFLPLDKNVRFVDPDDPEGKLFTDFPFVVCVPELPEGMQAGEDIHVSIAFSGFFIKVWAYRTEFMTGDQTRTDRPRLQLSPLLIGPTFVTENREFSTDPYLGLVLATLFTGCLLVIWFILWRLSVGDRKFAKTTLFRKHELQGDELRSWDEL